MQRCSRVGEALVTTTTTVESACHLGCATPSGVESTVHFPTIFSSPAHRQGSDAFIVSPVSALAFLSTWTMQQPAIVCIARHGARLDQANPQWADTAAEPFDPPLTYGGWLQCQMLGARIANEIRSVDNVPNASNGEDGDHSQGPRKRRKVIIHSSPYLRCLQTSIAIAAGLGEPKTVPRPPIRQQKSSLSKDVSSSILEEDEIGGEAQHSTANTKSKLRIDSYLGEWLNPGYYEHIKPPPTSDKLMASAKHYLRTPAEDIKGADFATAPIQEFAAVNWNEKESEANATPLYEKTGLRAVAAAGHAVTKKPRHLSFETSSRSQHIKKMMVGYRPPVPTYSIAPQDAIPIGFVAHARDACVDIDFEWDSMSKLAWGDGGAYGEEWGAMHRRFRNGLQKMLAHYEEEADGEGIVVVLVTHQAGCNALIRLMTGAPALHDVGTSSLTMAVRHEPVEKLSRVRSNERRGSLDLGIADDYDMTIIASTEHLRAGSNPLGLNSPRLGKSPAFASRRMVGADSPEGFSIGESAVWKPSGGLARSQSQRTFAADGPAGAATGLWKSQPGSPDIHAHSRHASVSAKELAKAAEVPSMWGEDQKETKLPVRSATTKGLWGEDSSMVRSRSPGKRRWTAVDRSP